MNCHGQVETWQRKATKCAAGSIFLRQNTQGPGGPSGGPSSIENLDLECGKVYLKACLGVTQSPGEVAGRQSPRCCICIGMPSETIICCASKSAPPDTMSDALCPYNVAHHGIGMWACDHCCHTAQAPAGDSTGSRRRHQSRGSVRSP